MADIDLFHHAVDSTRIDTFESIGWGFSLPGHDDLPSFLQPLFPYGFTKFMLLELVAAALIIALVVPVVRRLRTGELPRGGWSNAVEGLLLFIRDEIARPSIPDDHHEHTHPPHTNHIVGKPYDPAEIAHEHAGGAYGVPGPDIEPHVPAHRADYYLPLLWTLFLFIMICNLLGLMPFSGSPTASLMVTGALALVAFIVAQAAGIANNGIKGYMKSFVPEVDQDDKIMKYLGPPIVVGITCIEVMSLFIRNFVLAVRLFANMVGGHTALFLVLLFIQMVGTATDPRAAHLFWPVTLGSIVLTTLMMMLELFVALLQAYVFVMLTAVYIGLLVAPEH
jgi:F-type H+-transporting ATPase subunit a